VSIYLLHTPMAAPLMYALVAVAGFGTIGCQILVNAYVAMHFPDEVRATALGWTLGIGRLGAIVGPTFGGVLLSSGLDVAWNFYAFAIPAAIGALVVFLLPGKVPAQQSVTAPAAA
jgi:AAHS family benzoate transporter-like MFS transporter